MACDVLPVEMFRDSQHTRQYPLLWQPLTPQLFVFEFVFALAFVFVFVFEFVFSETAYPVPSVTAASSSLESGHGE